MKSKPTELQADLKQSHGTTSQLRAGGALIMKSAVLFLLSTIALTQAAVIRFDISPAGTDAAVGLSPTNQVPAVTNSTGSGNVISGGISFDTANSTLSFAIGYGSAAGFTDLTGLVAAMHIHGPAGAGTNAPVLFDLAAVNFVAPNPTNGGVIVGSVVYQSSQVSNLLAGLNYVNIHTATNPGGEIRGQLIPLVNVAPEIVCPAASTNECDAPGTYSAMVSDADGEPLQVVWTVNGVPVQTNSIAASGPPTTATVTFTSELPSGTNILGVTATDSSGNSSSCSTRVKIVDTTAPVITSVSATPNVLWPPNHKMVTVRLRAMVTDACSATTWRIVSVKSSESQYAIGSGNTYPDWRIIGNQTVELRAERSGKNKAGRVYTITVRARDAAGNLSDPATVEVTVPHDQGKNGKGDDDDDKDGGSGKPGKKS
ncbi:MAG: CHRD domain-containing protein [Opitutaceae bacterium]|nr:CHRD domain-containing protein [Verrucomicrobiales bacterium]